MNINYELYRIFYVVATQQSITKASKELNISQPAISKQIKALENQLGGELFIRTKKGVKLNENGQEIYNYVKQAINCFNNAELQFSNLKKLETGNIRIGISTTLTRIFLLKYLKEFHQLYPNISIQIFTDPSKVMRKMLKEGSLDILIAKENDDDNNYFNVTRIGTLHNCFIASDNFQELKNKTIPLAELDKYPILLQKSPSTSRIQFDQFCQEHNISISTKLEIASSTLLEDFVEIGLGIGLATKEYVQSKIKEGVIFEIKTTPKIPVNYYAILTLKDSYHSFGTNKLIELILKQKKES